MVSRWLSLLFGPIIALGAVRLCIGQSVVAVEDFRCEFTPPDSPTSTQLNCSLGWETSGVRVQLGSDEISLPSPESFVFRDFSVPGALIKPTSVQVGLTNKDFFVTGLDKCEVFVIEPPGNKVALKVNFRGFERNAFKSQTFVTALEDFPKVEKFGMSLESEFFSLQSGACVFHNLTVEYDVFPISTPAPSQSPTPSVTPAPTANGTVGTDSPTSSPTSNPSASPVNSTANAPIAEPPVDNIFAIAAGVGASAAASLVLAAVVWRRRSRKKSLSEISQSLESHEQLEISPTVDILYTKNGLLKEHVSVDTDTEKKKKTPSRKEISLDDELLAQELLAPSPTYARLQFKMKKQEGRAIAFSSTDVGKKKKGKPGVRAVRPTSKYLATRENQATKSIFRPSSQFLSQFSPRQRLSMQSSNPRASKSTKKQEDE